MHNLKIENLVLILFGGWFCICCSSENGKKGVPMEPAMITLNIDPDDAVSISMSALFEEEVAYIWLEDVHPKAQVASVSQVERVGDRLLVLDRMREQVLFVFNDRGQFLAKTDNKGEGPGQYLELGNFQVVENKIHLLSVSPPGLMVYDFEGNEISFQPLGFQAQSFAFDRDLGRFLFFQDVGYGTSKQDILVTDRAFALVLEEFPKNANEFRPPFSGNKNLFRVGNTIYYGRTLLDTVYQWNGKHLAPIYGFNFGKYGFDHKMWKDLKARLNPYELIQKFNAMEDYYFSPENAVTSGVHWLAAVGGGKAPISVYYQAEQDELKVFHRNVPNDLDGGPPLELPFYSFGKNQVAVLLSGRSLHSYLKEKESTMGPEKWNIWEAGQGGALASMAGSIAESENPLFMVLRFRE